VSKELIAVDPLAKAKTEWEWQDGKLVIRNAQDVTDIVERNKRWQNDGQGRGKNFHHVAQIPLTVYFDLQKRGIADDPKKFAQWLNDPDNRAFRVSLERV